MEEVSRITRAIARGDPEAFARLYEARFDRVYARAARLRGLGEADCLDIVQEAFTRMIRAMKPMETPEQLDAWIACVASSCVYDHLRREKRRRGRETRAARERADTRAAAEPGEGIEARLEGLRLEMDRLDAETAAMARLRWGRGLTLARVSGALGLTPGAVDGRLRRAAAESRARTSEVNDE